MQNIVLRAEHPVSCILYLEPMYCRLIYIILIYSILLYSIPSAMVT